jgi:hypothetical protein
MNVLERARQKRIQKVAPYVVLDDGKESKKPMIALVRSCDVSEIAPIIRALSIFSGTAADAAEQRCAVQTNGFKITNTLGDGVSVKPIEGETQAMPNLRKQFAVETRNQRKRRRQRRRIGA